MKKRYLLIALLSMVISMSNVKALKVDDCEVLVTFKINSSLDEDSYVCKNQEYGKKEDSIYYSGKGNVIKLNDFSAYYFANSDSDVVLDISSNNTLSLLHIDNGNLSVVGEGYLKFKENSFVKKIEKGEAVYYYKYKNNAVLNSDKKIFEGTYDEFINSYEELKEINKLSNKLSYEDFDRVQVLDYQKMVPIVVTESWVVKNIDTKLSKTVENGFGIIKPNPVESKLESDKVVLISSVKVDEKYKLNVDDLTEDEIGSLVLEKLEDTSLVSLYNISVYNGNKEVSMKDGKYTIKLKVDDSINDYDDLKIIYINDKKEIEEYIDATLEDGYVIFNTTHLSNYGIVGSLKTNEEHLVVSDNKNNIFGYVWKISILLSFVLVFVTLILFIMVKSGIYTKKKKRK